MSASCQRRRTCVRCSRGLHPASQTRLAQNGGRKAIRHYVRWVKERKFSTHGNMLIARKMAEIESRRTGEAWVALLEDAGAEDELFHAFLSRGRPSASLAAGGGRDLGMVDDDPQDLVPFID